MFFNPNKTILCYTQKFISLILILQCSIFSVSGQNNAVYNTENTNLSIPVLFVENVGQLEDMNGQPVPNVLFTAQLPDLQVFITTSGITFLTLEKKSPIEHYLIDRKVQWERIEMLLDGAHIKAENIVKTVSGITQYHIYNSQKPDGVHSSPITKKEERIRMRMKKVRSTKYEVRMRKVMNLVEQGRMQAPIWC